MLFLSMAIQIWNIWVCIIEGSLLLTLFKGSQKKNHNFEGSPK